MMIMKLHLFILLLAFSCIVNVDSQVCPPTHIWKDCGPACPPSCEDPTPSSTKECVRGCFCKEHLVLDGSACVPFSKCKCKPGFQWSNCGTACRPTCEVPNPPCTKPCVKGCFCKKPQVLLNNNTCIQLELCPCKPGFVYTDCGSACPPTCEDPNPTCPLKCVAGCFCKKPFLLHEDKCILPQQCPCRPDFEYKECGSKFPPTCEDPKPSCSKECVKGCFCINNRVLEGDKCVRINKCRCKPGFRFDRCGSACPPTCQDPKPICPPKCVEGCFCKKPLVLFNSTTCINLELCPCKPGSNWNNCGTACPATCKNPRPTCNKPCVEGCFCRAGLVLDNGKCIQLKDCPK